MDRKDRTHPRPARDDEAHNERTGDNDAQGISPERADAGVADGPVTATGPIVGENAPAFAEGQGIRGAGMTDIGDVAQNQMPGRPQNWATGSHYTHDETRRREFDRLVAEHENKKKKEKKG
jgi:hypothetical protein